MKRIAWSRLMLAAMLAAAITAAGCTKSETSPEPVDPTEPVEQQPPVQEEEDAEAELREQWEAVKDEAKEAAELIAFVDSRLPEASNELADTMIRDVFAFYEDDLEGTQEQFFSQDLQPVLAGLQLPVTEDDVDAIPDEAVRNLIRTKLAGNYKFITTEGSYFPIVDYGAFRKYTDALSYDLSAYIELKAMESDYMSASDGGLIISWDDVALRLLAAEDYLKLYPDTPEAKEVRTLLVKDYMDKYFYGMNNTPNFDYETFQVKEEARASYQRIAEEHPDTVVGQLAQRFLDVLAETGGSVYKGTPEDRQDIPEIKDFQDRLDAAFDRLLEERRASLS